MNGLVSQGRLFNHDLREELRAAQRFGGAEGASATDPFVSYASRALCLTSPGDVIQLPPLVRPYWGWINDHYGSVGLPVTGRVVWDMDYEVALRYPDMPISVFMFKDEAHRVRPNIRWRNIVDKMNSKNRFVSVCDSLGIPTPLTYCYESVAQVGSLSQFTYPVFLKLDCSVTGIGVRKCNDADELADFLKAVSGGFQIQAGLGSADFLNLTYDFDQPGEVKEQRISGTQQILENNAHAGNISHCEVPLPWEKADVLAGYMREQGCQGVIGFDFAVTPDGAFAIECNPRHNGSTSPAITARRLGADQWRAIYVHTRGNSFKGITLNGYGYDPGKGYGAVVTNWGCIDQGKLGFVICGNPRQQEEIEVGLRATL